MLNIFIHVIKIIHVINMCICVYMIAYVCVRHICIKKKKDVADNFHINFSHWLQV